MTVADLIASLLMMPQQAEVSVQVELRTRVFTITIAEDDVAMGDRNCVIAVWLDAIEH